MQGERAAPLASSPRGSATRRPSGAADTAQRHLPGFEFGDALLDLGARRAGGTGDGGDAAMAQGAGLRRQKEAGGAFVQVRQDRLELRTERLDGFSGNGLTPFVPLKMLLDVLIHRRVLSG